MGCELAANFLIELNLKEEKLCLSLANFLFGTACGISIFFFSGFIFMEFGQPLIGHSQ